MKGVRTRFVLDRDAEQTIARIAKPQTETLGEAIAGGIVGNVPVHHGVMRRSYSPTVEGSDDGARVYPNSSFWHWLEYGTRNNPAYRPIENTVRSLGVKYEAH